MAIQTIEVQRFSLTTSRSFETVVHLSYDRMVSFLAPYENREALAIAHDLNHKIERLINDAAVE
jgi:hypothetical protein